MIIKNLFSKVKNIIKRGLITLNRTDENGQCSYMETVSDYESIHPLGYYAKPKQSNNPLVMLFNVTGDEDNKVGLEFDNKKLPTVELAPGENVVYHQDKNSYVVFRNSGRIEIVAVQDLYITAIECNITAETTHTGDMHIIGDVDILGDVDIIGNVTVSGNISAGSGASPTTITLIGDIIQTGDQDITGDVDITGNLDVSLDLDVVGDITCNECTINGTAFSTHTHSPGTYKDHIGSGITGVSGAHT